MTTQVQPHSHYNPTQVNNETLALITFIYLLKYFKKQNFINFENWCSIEGWGGGIGTLYGPFLSAFFLLPLTTLVSSPNQTLALLFICRDL